MDEEAGEVLPLFKQLSKGAGTPELVKLGEDLYEHEDALKHYAKGVVDGKPDDEAAKPLFDWLEKHGVSKEEAIMPRHVRENIGGDEQHLVFASFADEDAADRAAREVKNWDKASEHMKDDGIGVLVKDKDGKIKNHKLGRTAGKKGMGIGVALGLLAAALSGGVALVGGVVIGAVGGRIIGHFFRKGLKMSEKDVTRISNELDEGRAIVGVLAWDDESDALADQLEQMGGTVLQTVEVVEPAAEATATS